MTPEDDGPALEGAELRRALGLIAFAAACAVVTGLAVVGIGGGLLATAQANAAPPVVTTKAWASTAPARHST